MSYMRNSQFKYDEQFRRFFIQLRTSSILGIMFTKEEMIDELPNSENLETIEISFKHVYYIVFVYILFLICSFSLGCIEWFYFKARLYHARHQKIFFNRTKFFN